MVKSASPPPRLRRPPPLDPSSLGADRFKGVRRRSWGRWVSEIRIPHSRDKIWLGSYSTAEQAARAYDIASLLLRGPSCAACLNFSDSTSLVSMDNEIAALVAGGIESARRTIQVTAAAAAKSTAAVGGAGCSNGVDGSSQMQEEDMDDDDQGELNLSQCSETNTRDCSDGQSQLCSYDHSRGHNYIGALCNSVSDSCWIQDVLSLIVSPKLDRTSPAAAVPAWCLPQLSPSKAKCSTSPTSMAIPMHSSCSSYGAQVPSKATSPEYLLHMLFDDFQHPLEGLASDGFTAISAAVTTRKRFDTETAGPSCEADGTQLWSYVC